MKWLETEFLYQGRLFTMIGLELTYSREKLAAIIAGIGEPARLVVGHQLYFDFAFMAGVYPGIAALCMLARSRWKQAGVRRLLFMLASLQTVAWLADIRENIYLLTWLKSHTIDGSFLLYHIVVSVKWAIAVLGLLAGLIFLISSKRRKIEKTLFFI